MAHLIDKDALVAEIERRKQESESNCSGYKSYEEHRCNACTVDFYEEFLEIINTLEVKEVDLDKEISQQIEKYYDECENKLTSMSDDDTDISFLTLDKLCRHFFELGLKATQKGEKV